MDWINYHHLLYFWVVAREGSISKACKHLHLAQPTISGQLSKLEGSLGVKLFRRVGRGLELTEEGQLVFQYADEIFSLGRELTDVLRGRPSGRPLRLKVGVPDILPKLMVYKLLEPAIQLDDPVELVCYEGKLDQLLADLALHSLDLVLSDCPAGPQTHVRVFNHLLGSSAVSIYGTSALIDRYQADFPTSLDGAPMVLPTRNTTIRRLLEEWFAGRQIRPDVRAEFEDSALLKAFGQAGIGLFAGPTSIEAEITRQYDVHVMGQIHDLRETYYAISIERRLKHPAVKAIREAARSGFLDP